MWCSERNEYADCSSNVVVRFRCVTLTATTRMTTNKTSIVQTVATGSIVPKEEILIKPNISGIVEEVYIEAGQYVKSGDLIAKIQVIPNVSSLTNARNNSATNQTALQTAKINLQTQQANYDRQKALFEKGVISANDFEGIKNTYLQAKQSVEQAEINVTSARQNFDIIKTGTTSGMGDIAQTQIRATVSGMVLDVPVKAGKYLVST